MPTSEQLLMCIEPNGPLGHVPDVDKDYVMFVNHFVRVIVGCALYDSLVAKRVMSEFVGVSDEALALLIWENQEERWQDMVARGTNKSPKQGKYTDGGKSRTESGRSRKGKGWSNKGIRRFKELCMKIEENRKTQERKDFETNLLNEKKEELEAGRSKKRKPNMIAYVDDEDGAVDEVYTKSIGIVGV